MSVRRLHRILGLILLLPILGWAATGFIFFVKPGYGPAYGMLLVRALPLAPGSSLAALRPEPGWLEVRALRTVLGEHLLVREESGWSQLDPASLRPSPLPDEAALRSLIEDAIQTDPSQQARYGAIASLARQESDDAEDEGAGGAGGDESGGGAAAGDDGGGAGGRGSASAVTTTGVTIELDWATLSLSQSGRDTRRIDALYRIHYLQWTGIKSVDRVLGVAGLISLVAIAAFGLRLAFPGRRQR